MKPILLVVLALAGLDAQTRFLSYDEARAVLDAYGQDIDSARWPQWIAGEDLAIRARLERGEEDTLSNLLRFGVTFTKEYPIDREYLSRYGHSTLVDSFAENRANDLIRALQSPSANEGMKEMRLLLENKGFSFKTASGRAQVKKYLLANLARERDEFNAYREKLKTADITKRSHLYAERGISLDTNLWPDFALDVALRELLQKGLLKPGSVRRIAIVGPGLDFANKEYGNDFYPPQTIQPFAVIDSLARLGIADPKSLELFTLDISSNVNLHVQRAKKAALAGKSYTVQLPWNSAVPWSQEYLANFTKYWQALGDQIGTTTAPVTVPVPVARDVHLRAVTIRPQVVARITPVDMNVVFQRLPGSTPDHQFDLIIGTNIFIYYGAFEQSLARANLSSMLRPEGLLLTNDFLADEVPSKLTEVQKTTLKVSLQPEITEYVFCYKREP